jgi:hypothetical protein
MNEITAYAAFGGLVLTMVQFLKFLDAKAWTKARNQAVVWLGGITVALIGAQTSFAGSIPAFDITLANCSTWDQVFFGLTIGGITSAGYEAIKAVSTRRSALETGE